MFGIVPNSLSLQRSRGRSPSNDFRRMGGTTSEEGVVGLWVEWYE